MRIWRASDRVFQPWKNGGGETATVLGAPEGAGPDGFDWRISTAIIARSGPFSPFPGCARLFTVIAGAPVTLHLSDGRCERRGPGDGALRFSGDLGCDCHHDGAPTLALNLMTRAPFRAEIGPGPFPGAARRFLFACAPIPSLGLAAHDMAETDAVAEGALSVALYRAPDSSSEA